MRHILRKEKKTHLVTLTSQNKICLREERVCKLKEINH